jgi:5-hydroxyisourate hydrolase-like protein (transthyretin family)
MTQPSPAEKSAVELLEAHKKRWNALKERHTRAQVRLEADKAALQEAQAQARELFGVDDLEALRALFKERQSANDQLVREFGLQLDSVERSLADIERQLAA